MLVVRRHPYRELGLQSFVIFNWFLQERVLADVAVGVAVVLLVDDHCLVVFVAEFFMGPLSERSLPLTLGVSMSLRSL